ncbi:hypothetical protein MUP37_01785, partial [Candidatus Bathyarchaeota archaeon]|nr:hypothetical protein [Candidatus Bathyarchaeota archaeon]
MAGKRFVGLALILLLSGTFAVLDNLRFRTSSSAYCGTTRLSAVSYENVTTHEGDLVINGTQTYALENCTCIQTGDITVRDQGRLIVRNTELTLNQTYPGEYGILIADSGSLIMEAVNATSPKGFSITFLGEARVQMNEVLTGALVEPRDNSSLSISNSTLYAGLSIGDHAEATISNTTHLYPYITLDFRRYSAIPIRMTGLKPDFLEFWNIYTNCSAEGTFNLTVLNSYVGGWEVAFSGDASAAEIKDSTVRSMWLDFSNMEIEMNDLKTGLLTSWHLGGISVVNSSVVEHWTFILTDVNATFSNCTIHLNLGGSNNISVKTSKIRYLIVGFGNSVIHSENTVFTEAILLSDSNLYLYGDIAFEEAEIILFVSARITRNFDFLEKDSDGNPVSNAELTVLDQNSTVVWSGFTDQSGMAECTLTFMDANYTDPLRLEATKGNLSAIADVSCLSDTPVTLVMQVNIMGDVNGDLKVDMKDVSYVARRFMCLPGDPLWDPTADINADSKIDMKDISTVARHFGEHSTRAPEPIIRTGVGDKVTSSFVLEEGVSIFTLTHDGDSNFAIWLYSKSGDTEALIVNAIGEYSGSIMVGVGDSLEASTGEHLLEIKADGN